MHVELLPNYTSIAENLPRIVELVLQALSLIPNCIHSNLCPVFVCIHYFCNETRIKINNINITQEILIYIAQNYKQKYSDKKTRLFHYLFIMIWLQTEQENVMNQMFMIEKENFNFRSKKRGFIWACIERIISCFIYTNGNSIQGHLNCINCFYLKKKRKKEQMNAMTRTLE